MKHIFVLGIMLFATVNYAQNTGLVVGKVLDKELENAPLAFANISIKGTPIEVNADITGLFIIENLEAGDYTLVCSFAGYETQEINVHVDGLQPSDVNISLSASNISLNELVLLTSTTLKEDETFNVLN